MKKENNVVECGCEHGYGCGENGCTRPEGTECKNGMDCGECESCTDCDTCAVGCDEESLRFNFGVALNLMKDGLKVRRAGWNGKGMFIFLADSIEFHTDANLQCVSHLEGELVQPAIVMKTAENKFCVGWLANQTDMLAADWELYEEEV